HFILIMIHVHCCSVTHFLLCSGPLFIPPTFATFLDAAAFYGSTPRVYAYNIGVTCKLGSIKFSLFMSCRTEFEPGLRGTFAARCTMSLLTELGWEWRVGKC